MTNITDIKLGDAKRKNGHKPDCACHICENIKNKAKQGGYEKEAEMEKERMNGGSKKKNGHKMDCECPICKNMKNAKKGLNKQCNCMACKKSGIVHGPGCKCNKKGGSQKKRSNGHKLDCKYPICKNMRKTKRGGDDDELNDMEIDVNDNKDNNNDNRSSTDSVIGDNLVNNNKSSDENTVPASEKDYEDLPLGESNGGTRKHKKGNKKWGGKTKKSKKRVRSHRHH